MDLLDDLDRLRAAIVGRYAAEYTVAKEYVTSPVANDGYDGLQRRINFFGDSRDAMYSIAGNAPGSVSRDELYVRDDDFLVVYGVIHSATGKATYSNFNVYTDVKELGLGSVFDAELKGSAADYLPGDPAAASLLYAWKVARDCRGAPRCLELKARDCPQVPALGADAQFSVAFRSYLEPGTNVGPAPTEVLYERVIKFSRRP